MWHKKPKPQPKDEFIQPEILPVTEYRFIVGADGAHLYWVNEQRTKVGLLPISEFTGEPYDPEWGDYVVWTNLQGNKRYYPRK